jgi:hypothetical protein
MPEKFPPPLHTEDARQGETTGRMRMVLTISFIGAVVVLAALLLWWRDIGQSHLPAMVSAATALLSR